MRTAYVYNFLVEANIMASLAILLMLIVRKFFRRSLGSRAICFAWLLVAIRLLCPLTLPNPAIHEIRSPYAADEAIRPIAGQVKVRLEDAVDDLYFWSYRSNGKPADSAVTSAIREVNLDMSNGALAKSMMKIYLAGCLGTAAWFVFSNVRFRRKLRADRIAPLDGEMLEKYEALCREKKIKPLPVYYVDPLPSACLVGVIKPYIALPLTASPQETLPVLLHEICHYRGKDHLFSLLRLLCCAVHWFNPLVWLAADLSRTDGELGCDERVTEHMDDADRKGYAGVLVLAASRKTAPGLPVLATGMTMTGKKLKNRVKSILEGGKERKIWRVLFMSAASLLLVGAFATAEYVKPLYTGKISFPELPHLSFETLETEDEYMEQAKLIWQLPAVRQELSQAEWQLSDSDWKPAAMKVEAEKDGHVYTMHLSLQGEMIGLHTDETIWDGELQKEAFSKERHAMQYFARDFVLSLWPSAFDENVQAYDRGNLQGEEGVYAVFEFFPQPSWSITVVLELGDPIRVVSCHLGNG